MRGILGENLFPEVILYFCEAYGSWLRDKHEARGLHATKCRVLVGMDSRTSGPLVKSLTIGALQSVGIEVIDVDVCATPVLLFGHKYLNCDGTVIISASHNPPQYNGMKCLSYTGTFLSREELDEINLYFHGKQEKRFVSWNRIIPVTVLTNLTNHYIEHMRKFIDLNVFKSQKQHPLKFIVDPGAGAGSGLTARILRDLGCIVEEINDTMVGPYQFPREFEPIKAHLTELSVVVQKTGAVAGFAHDCDADRLGLINEKGEIYPEDIILGLIVNDMLQQKKTETEHPLHPILVTNCASSLIFDDLAHKYNAEIIYTPVGERYLAEKMTQLVTMDVDKKNFVFGGEGSCGGVMLPMFNNTRDGIFAAIKIAEILIRTAQPLSTLVDQLPHYVSLRKKLQFESKVALGLMQKLKSHLKSKEISFQEIDNDVKTTGPQEWTLVHPSNTEPIIRIITEAPTEKRAAELLDEMDQLLAKLAAKD
jgi:phosphomannomutase